MTPDQKEAIVAEAYSWLRTPYIHRGAIKGVGVDCGMLLIEVYSNVLKIERPDVGNYTSDWFLHRDEPVYIEWLSKFAEKRPGVDQLEVGDVAMFNFGRHAAHGAIVVSEDLMIHAYRIAGQVELCEIRALANKSKGRGQIDSVWTVRA